MTKGPQNEKEWRQAEALAIARMHGSDAPRWIAERIGELALAGDLEGVERFRDIATSYAELELSHPERSAARH